ncbi:hypothetical protein [Halovenus marina]|uniref:hypothetical protein n=1 Tax=Halovenus marina TaxID=3396621 RepID=UPI003F5443E2
MIQTVIGWLQRQLRPWYRHIISEVGWTANVYVRVHDLDELRARYPEWDDLDREEKLERTRGVPPRETDHVSNVTCVGLHEYAIDDLHPDQTVDIDASHLAVGSDDGTQPSTGDTSLNNQVGVVSITDSIDVASTLKSSVFIDSSQLNGNTLAEVGLTTASSGGTLLNHALISPIQKDADSTVTIDVDLTAEDA